MNTENTEDSGVSADHTSADHTSTILLTLPRHPAASLTVCAGTWLEHAPDTAEQQRIDTACQEIRQHRKLAVAFYSDPLEAKKFSLELFRDAAFHPLHLNDCLVELIINTVGEPPVVDDPDNSAFAQYMRQAVFCIANSRVRRDLSGQLRRFLPRYVEQGQLKEAVAIDNNAFRTALGNEATPFLVQMSLGGLVRWYDRDEVAT